MVVRTVSPTIIQHRKQMKKRSIKYQLKSFRWAFNGLSEFFKQEIKALIHSIAAVLAIVAGMVLKLSSNEWLWIVFAIALVFFSELLNTIVERIADTIPDKFDPVRGSVKDMAAGAVLITSVAALIAGCLIFIPKITELCQLP